MRVGRGIGRVRYEADRRDTESTKRESNKVRRNTISAGAIIDEIRRWADTKA